MVTPPYGCNAGGSQRRADVGIGPYEKERKFHQPPGPAAHSGASAPAGARKWVGIAAKIIPKGAINLGQSLSQPAADSSLCTREPLGRGCGLPRRFAPRNDSPKPLSFRGGPTGRRGNPSFLRWTGVRAAVPRAWPPPTKFRSEIWGVGQVVGPYGSPRLPGQRLAKRKARKEQLVKFGLCPMTSERSTAYWVRKSDESPARALVGAASTEQNGLEPHPAARQGASRP